METLRHVRLDLGYTLRTWDTGRTDSRGQSYIGYEMRDASGESVFTGDDFAGSPMHADDSDETLRALLNFLTLRPGDTDPDYFADYTERQRRFVREDAETLSVYGIDDSGIDFEEER